MNLEVIEKKQLVFGLYEAGNIFIMDDKPTLTAVLALLVEASAFIRDRLSQL